MSIVPAHRRGKCMCMEGRGMVGGNLCSRTDASRSRVELEFGEISSKPHVVGVMHLAPIAHPASPAKHALQPGLNPVAWPTHEMACCAG
jgi:hypothetical protein